MMAPYAAQVLELVRQFSSANKPIASICHGQLILTAAGVVQGTRRHQYAQHVLRSHDLL